MYHSPAYDAFGKILADSTCHIQVKTPHHNLITQRVRQITPSCNQKGRDVYCDVGRYPWCSHMRPDNRMRSLLHVQSCARYSDNSSIANMTLYVCAIGSQIRVVVAQVQHGRSEGDNRYVVTPQVCLSPRLRHERLLFHRSADQQLGTLAALQVCRTQLESLKRLKRSQRLVQVIAEADMEGPRALRWSCSKP